MDEVVRQAGTAGSSDRAATAAWTLFEPMQFGVSAHPKVFTTADQGLAESIAGAMCKMTNCTEMAMLWTEVYLSSFPFTCCQSNLLLLYQLVQAPPMVAFQAWLSLICGTQMRVIMKPVVGWSEYAKGLQ